MLSPGLTTDEEWRVFERVLQAPALWPLQIIVGVMGLELAVEACREPDAIPAEAREALESAGYGPHRLPPPGDVDDLLRACRIYALRMGRMRGATLQAVAEEAGGTLKEAHAALRVLHRYYPKGMWQGVTP